MAYTVEVLLDSISEAGDRLTTMEVTFPRIVLSEFNTHRVFSRNSASSRAIPVVKQLKLIEDDTFMPIYWGRNQSGMQANEELSAKDRRRAEAVWNKTRDDTVRHVRSLLDLGVHKQIVSRLLEPFMWHTVIVTATEWTNFFALRANPDAQPEIQVAAQMMKESYFLSKPTLLKKEDWHLPLIQPDERSGGFEHSEDARKISAARCARVSYLTHDGRRDLAADITLYNRLVSGGHMSPLEHVATPNYYVPGVSDTRDEFGPQSITSGNFRGWKQLRKFILHEDVFQG